MKPNFFNKSLSATLAVLLLVPTTPAWSQQAPPHEAQPYATNMGPDITDPQQRNMMDIIYRQTPEFKYLSDMVMPDPVFRHAMGPNAVRLNFGRNAIKIFAQGQDSVDDAEVAKSPGIGTGYAQYVQSMANALGVHYSLMTTNAFHQTIKGQYGAFDHPVVYVDKNGKRRIGAEKITDNNLWTLANGPESILAQHRNRVWVELFRNNPDSARLVILYGGASQDGFAQLINSSENFRILPKMKIEELARLQVPATSIEWGGGNNVFPVLLNKEGKDLYQELFDKEPELKGLLRAHIDQEIVKTEQIIKTEKDQRLVTSAKERLKELQTMRPLTGSRGPLKLDYSKPASQLLAAEALKFRQEVALERMAFTGGGLHNSGLLNPAQMRGYDYSNIEKLENGQWVKAETLQGMKVGDFVVPAPIAVIASPHPTAFARGKDKSAAGRALSLLFKPLRDLALRTGWGITPDLHENGQSRKAPFFEGQNINFDKALLPRNTLPFGIPEDLIRPTQSPDRIGPQVLVIEPPSLEELRAKGIRNLGELFDADLLEAAKRAKPIAPVNPADVGSQRPRQQDTYLAHDPGPNEELQEFIDRNLPKSILDPKPGVEKIFNRQGEDITLDKVGSGSYFIKSPRAGFYAHHRGTLENPRVLIMHDPIDLDDKNTWRAATGERGVYLNGLMRDLGVESQQLVLKTIPADMNGATAEEWEVVRKATEGYREAMVQRILSGGSVEAIFTDGPVAQVETERILNKLGVKNIPVIDIKRGQTPSVGIAAAGAEAKRLPQFANAKILAKPAAIPTSQLPWTSRATEGKYIGMVIEAKGEWKGRTRALVMPTEIFRQQVQPAPATVMSVEAINRDLREMGVRTAADSIPKFLKETSRSGAFAPEALVPRDSVSEAEMRARARIYRTDLTGGSQTTSVKPGVTVRVNIRDSVSQPSKPVVARPARGGSCLSNF